MSHDSSPTQPERPERPELPQFDASPTGAPARPTTPAPGLDETQVLPSTPTARTPIVPPATPYTYATEPSPYAAQLPASAWATPAPAQTTADAAAQRSPRWSGRKTAVTAGLVLVLTSAGAIAAAAAMPADGAAQTGRFGGPGQGRAFPFPGGRGQQGQQGQQVLPNQQGLPGQSQPRGGQQVPPNQQGQQGQQGGSQVPGLPDSGSDSGSDSGGGTDTTGGLGGLDPDQLLQLSPDQLLQLLQGQGQLGPDGSGGLDSPPQDGTPSQDGTARTT